MAPLPRNPDGSVTIPNFGTVPASAVDSHPLFVSYRPELPTLGVPEPIDFGGSVEQAPPDPQAVAALLRNVASIEQPPGNIASIEQTPPVLNPGPGSFESQAVVDPSGAVTLQSPLGIRQPGSASTIFGGPPQETAQAQPPQAVFGPQQPVEQQPSVEAPVSTAQAAPEFDMRAAAERISQIDPNTPEGLRELEQAAYVLNLQGAVAQTEATKQATAELSKLVEGKRVIAQEAVVENQRINAQEDERIAEIDALREERLQRRDLIDPNRNRFNEGSNQAAAVMLAALEGFMRPGQPSQVLNMVNNLIEKDVQAMARSIEKEDKAIAALDADELRMISRARTGREREALIRSIKLDAIGTAIEQYTAQLKNPAQLQQGQALLAGIAQARTQRTQELQLERDRTRANLIQANAAASNAKTNSLQLTAANRANFLEEVRRTGNQPITEEGLASMAKVYGVPYGEARELVQAQRAQADVEQRAKDAKILAESGKSLLDVEKTALDIKEKESKFKVPGIPSVDGKSEVQATREDQAAKLAENTVNIAKILPMTGALRKLLEDNPLERFTEQTEAGAELRTRFSRMVTTINRMDAKLGGQLTQLEASLVAGQVGSRTKLFNRLVPIETTARSLAEEHLAEVKKVAPNADIDKYRRQLVREAGFPVFGDESPPPEAAGKVSYPGSRFSLAMNSAESVKPETVYTNLVGLPQLLKDNPDWVNTPQVRTEASRGLAALQSQMPAEAFRELSDTVNAAFGGAEKKQTAIQDRAREGSKDTRRSPK